MKQYLLLCFLMFSVASALFAQAPPTCADPIIIAPSSLPFSSTDNTFNYGDSFDGFPGDAATCGTSDRYLDGDIVFYSFTPEVTGDYRFSISSLTNGYSGMFLYQGCGNFNQTCEGGVANPGTADRVLDLTLTSGSEYILVISTFSDFEQSIGYQLNIKSLLPGGTTCADPIVVPSASLPFSDTDKTSNYGDDVNGAPGNLTTCGTNGAYLDGDDVFYSFTPSTSGAYRMTLSNLSGNNAAMFLYADCADVGSSCLEGAINGTSTADLFFNVSLTANEDYLLAISSFGFFQPSVGYTVTIEAIPPGEVCASPIVIEPFSTSFTTNDNTANYGDDISGSPGNTGCGNTSRYLDGDEVFYSFTPSVSDDYTFTLSNLSAGYSGFFLYSNCTAVGSSCLEGIANTTSDDRIFEVALTAGEEYVLVISSWGSFQQSVGYTLTVSSTIGQTCSNPIIVPTASLPFTTMDNTGTFGDDVDGLPGDLTTCGTSSAYLDGDDVFYSFTPSTSDVYRFALSNLSVGFSGIFLYSDCTDVGSGCLAGIANPTSDDRFFEVPLTVGEAYVLVISSLGSSQQSVDYTLSISLSTIGNTCDDPIVVNPASLPFITTDNTGTYGDDNDGAPGSSATCGTSNPYLNGDDVFYRFTPSVSDLYIITLSNLVSSSGISAGAMFLYADCASVGSVCLEGDADIFSPERKFTLPLVAGEDYLIAISTSPNPQSISYTLTIETEPPGSNCDDPLIVDPAALPFTTTDNTSNYGDGVGGVPGSEAGCGTDSRYLNGNEVFYSFTPAASANYTLTLSNLSNGSSGIFLYADCADVGANCLEGVANFSSQERVISVSLIAGEAYLIVISTFAASSPQTVGYTLNIQLTPPGVTCSRPIDVGALPYTTTDNTSNYADNVDGVPGSLATCGTDGNYLSGDDVFYSFTPPASNVYTFTLAGVNSIASGMFLYADCADVGSVCLEGVATTLTNVRTFDVFLETGEEYILAISTDATFLQSMEYTLNIRAAPSGSICTNPLVVGDLPFVTTDNTNRYGDYVDQPGGTSGGSCNTSDAYLRGDEVFYRFTPAISDDYKFTLSNLSSNGSGIFLYADCGDVGMACLGSVGNSGAADRFFKATLTAGEDYYLVVSSDGGFTSQQSVGYTLTVEVVPPGEVCANPIVIPALPYTTTDNTGNYGNDVDGVAGEFEACGAFGSYLRGDDVFYRFTADRSTTYEFTLSGLSTSYSGIFLYSDCGDVGMNCIAGTGDDNASTRNFTAFLTAGEEYLIAISKDPNGPADQSVGYTLTVDYAPPGNICQDPIFVDPNALPYTTTDNTSNYGDDVDSRLGTATCGNTLGFISGDDVFYSFTPATSGLYRITLSGLNATGSSIFVFAGCADVGSVCVESFADYTTNDRIFNTSLTAGTGYIVLVSSRAPTQSIDYTLTIEDAPPGINCNDPIVVDPASLPFTTTDNTGQYGDFVDGIPGSEATCMVDNDFLSGDEVFYSFTPAVSGDYTFTLSNLSTVFSGMFLYADCANIGTECLEGAGNNNTDNRVIITSLTAGVTYVLVISTVAGGGTQNIGYTLSLDFTFPGNVCSSPIVIAPLSLPFTVTDNTSNYSNNLSGSPGTSCGSTSRYLDGNNAFYSFTPSISEDYTFTLSNLSDIGAGMFLYADCASVGTECLAGAATGRDRQDRGFTTSLTAGEAYILQISTWAPPQTTTYTLNVSGETVLPVTLTSFTGQATAKTNKLSWTTAREEAADRFILERTSTQNGNWEAIGEVMATGNSRTEVSYELIDAQPTPVAFYRLKMMDLDGSFTYSDIVRLENDAVASEQLSIFPVPTTNSLTVSFTAKVSGTANIELTDLNGRTISRQKVDVGAGIMTERMDLSSVPSGVYLLRVVVGDRQLLKRVVRQ